jgi:hypothetical protein
LSTAEQTEESVFNALGLPVPRPEEKDVIGGKPIWVKDV